MEEDFNSNEQNNQEFIRSLKTIIEEKDKKITNLEIMLKKEKEKLEEQNECINKLKQSLQIYETKIEDPDFEHWINLWQNELANSPFGYWIKKNRTVFIIVWQEDEYVGLCMGDLHFNEFKISFEKLFNYSPNSGLNPIQIVLKNDSIGNFRFVFNHGNFENNNPNFEHSNLHMWIDFDYPLDFKNFSTHFKKAKLLGSYGQRLNLNKIKWKRDSYDDEVFILRENMIKFKTILEFYKKFMNVIHDSFEKIKIIVNNLSGCQWGIVFKKIKNSKKIVFKFYIVAHNGEATAMIQKLFKNVENRRTLCHHPNTRRFLFDEWKIGNT